jgi:hypothetical protein
MDAPHVDGAGDFADKAHAKGGGRRDVEDETGALGGFSVEVQRRRAVGGVLNLVAVYDDAKPRP